MMVSGGGIGSAINTTSKTMELSGQNKEKKIAQFKKVKWDVMNVLNEIISVLRFAIIPIGSNGKSNILLN